MQRALLYLLVAASYLLLAGGPRWTMPPLLTVALAAAAVNPRRSVTLGPRSRAFDLTLLVVVAAAALAIVPLPRPVVDWLSPRALELRRATRLVPDQGWVPLSVDPAATSIAIATLVLGLLAYRVARAVFDADGGIRWFCRLLAWAAAAAAVAAVIQRSLAPTLILGWFPAEAAGARPFGAFVNRNHFAAWLLLALPLTSGYLVAHIRHRFRNGYTGQHWPDRLGGATVPLVVSITTLLGVLLFTLSRSAALGCGVAAATWWLLARPRVAVDRRGWPLVVAVAGAVLLASAALVDLDAWAARFGSTLSADRADGRLVIWRETLPVVRDFWATGSGAGTYGLTMLAYQESRIWVPHLAAWAHFNQAHNHYLQVMAEGGLLLGVPVSLSLIALAGAARRALRDDRTEMFWIRAGAAAGLAGVAAQSLWEVPLTMPANAVLAAVAAAVLLHEPRARRDDAIATNGAPRPRG